MDSVNLPQDLQLLAAVFIAILGIVGALMARGLVLKLVVLGAALLIAAYLAGLLPQLT